ncbi:hypothetical protein RI103_34750 [Paraburkholderia sp. FT54]|uniref:hypothetical protein n=1 Tax=Paraburkholderia sp. FT54 TaxID=3074437 RepID=UPI00287801D7|nr:hypothetical protein [Paraburkholderia sp. FT54]WNC95037.1 hypothetical protein RI103_34750 [Paraburkholderia sp. FT54]
MIPKRTIKEIVVKYQLEPSIREVFVEGLFDRDLFKWFLKKLELSAVKVYPIASVEVDGDMLKRYGLTSGERQRLIAFAEEASALGAVSTVVSCVIDSDLDYVLGIERDCPLLTRTDGTSAELLAWKTEVLQRFCSMVLGSDRPEAVVETILAVEPKICNVFLLRCALAKLGLSWELIEVDILFDRKNPITFDDYCRRVANKNSGLKDLPSITECLKELGAQAEAIPRQRRMRGHDLMEAARKVLQNTRFDHGCLRNGLDLSRTLMGSLEWENVQADPLVNSFRRLSA